MTSFVADENFNGNVITALRRRHPEVDVVTVQELEMSGAPDPEVLEWAAQHKRLVVSNDVRTMTAFAIQRVAQDRPMPGLVEIRRRSIIRRIVEELAILSHCSEPEEWEGQIIYIPM